MKISVSVELKSVARLRESVDLAWGMNTVRNRVLSKCLVVVDGVGVLKLSFV